MTTTNSEYFKNLNLVDLSISKMLEMQHEMVQTAIDLKLDGSSVQPRKSFKNRDDAIRTLTRLDAAIFAAQQGGQKAGAEVIGAPQTQLPVHKDILVEKTIEQQAAPEVVDIRRKNILSSGEIEVQKRKETEMAKTATKTTTKKVSKTSAASKPVKEKVAKAGGTSRRFTDQHKIYKLVDKNPKREGTMSHDYWKFYKNGMTINAYLSNFENRARGWNWLNWDLAHNLIEIKL